jgi:hypothetical protein
MLLDPGITENALLGYLFFRIIVYFFIGTSFYAVAITSASFLVNKDDPVFPTLIDRLARTGIHAWRVAAMVAYAWQVKIIGIGEGPIAHILIPVACVCISRRFGFWNQCRF